MSAEFRAFAANKSSPVTAWLRSLARLAHEERGGSGVGAEGGGVTTVPVAIATLGGSADAPRANESSETPAIASVTAPRLWVRFGGIEVGGFEFRVRRHLLRDRRLELLHATGQIVAAALEVAQLSIEFRRVGDELLASGPQSPILLRHERALVLQRRSLLLDLLETFLLGREFRPQRGQLFADRVQAPFVVLQFPLGALELLASSL